MNILTNAYIALLCVIFQPNHSECHIHFVNSLRKNMGNVFGIDYSCVLSQYGDLSVLQSSRYLDNLSSDKALELEDEDCPFEHDTCFKNCRLYRSCSWYDRVTKNGDVNNIVYGEILSSFQNEIDTFYYIMSESTHCSIIMSKDFKSIGYAISPNRNYLVMVFSSKMYDYDTEYYTDHQYDVEIINHKNKTYEIYKNGSVLVHHT